MSEVVDNAPSIDQLVNENMRMSACLQNIRAQVESVLPPTNIASTKLLPMQAVIQRAMRMYGIGEVSREMDLIVESCRFLEQQLRAGG